MKNIGDLGPEFALYNQRDEVIILRRILNNADALVVYFFPQAGAPGCTREALGFKELYPEFQKRNVRIVGITSSPAAELKQFGQANDLPFDVVTDPYKQSIDEWGATRAESVARMTYVLNGNGRITHVFPRADVFKHAAEVLALFPDPTPAQAPAAQAPAAQAPAAPAGGDATQAPAQAPAQAAASTPGELVVAAARATLQLLLAHQRGGGAVPEDVAQLAAQIAKK